MNRLAKRYGRTRTTTRGSGIDSYADKVAAYIDRHSSLSPRQVDRIISDDWFAIRTGYEDRVPISQTAQFIMGR